MPNNYREMTGGWSSSVDMMTPKRWKLASLNFNIPSFSCPSTMMTRGVGDMPNDDLAPK